MCLGHVCAPWGVFWWLPCVPHTRLCRSALSSASRAVGAGWRAAVSTARPCQSFHLPSIFSLGLILDSLEAHGIVSPRQATRPRLLPSPPGVVPASLCAIPCPSSAFLVGVRADHFSIPCSWEGCWNLPSFLHIYGYKQCLFFRCHVYL